MSCIIAQKVNDHFIFVSDTQSSTELFKINITDDEHGKSCRCLDCPNALIAHTGYAKDISIVRQIDHLFDDFDEHHKTFNYRYVVGVMLPKMHKEFVDLGIYKNEHALELPSRFFVAKDDKAYHITPYGAVIEIADFACEGSGSIAATGAYFASQNEQDALIRCLKAIRASIKYNSYCGYPILVQSTKDSTSYLLDEEETNAVIKKERTLNI